MSASRLSSHLFVLRDEQGARDPIPRKVVRALQQALEPVRIFRGLVLKGSRVRGYGQAGSDLDLVVLYRLPDGVSAGRARHLRASLELRARRRAREIGRQYRLSVSLHWAEMNPESGLQSWRRGDRIREWTLLAELAVGRRLAGLRRAWLRQAAGLHRREQVRLLRALLGALLEKDFTQAKVAGRLGKERMASLRRCRRRLWSGRLRALWAPSGSV